MLNKNFAYTAAAFIVALSIAIAPVGADMLYGSIPPATKEAGTAGQPAGRPKLEVTIIEEDSYDRNTQVVHGVPTKDSAENLKEMNRAEVEALEVEKALYGPMQSGIGSFVIKELDGKDKGIVEKALANTDRQENLLRANIALADPETVGFINSDLARLHRYKASLTGMLGSVKETKNNHTPVVVIDDNDGLGLAEWLVIGAFFASLTIGAQRTSKWWRTRKAEKAAEAEKAEAEAEAAAEALREKRNREEGTPTSRRNRRRKNRDTSEEDGGATATEA